MIKWHDIRIWKWVIVVTVVLVAAFTMSGCKSKEYVNVPEYHTEYVRKTDTIFKLDSVYVKDSVYVYRNGDTVTISKVAYRDRWCNIYKVKTDTIIKNDSIPYPVGRELTSGERRMMELGRYSLFFLVAAVILLAFLLYHKKTC